MFNNLRLSLNAVCFYRALNVLLMMTCLLFLNEIHAMDSELSRISNELSSQRVTLASHSGLGYGGSQDKELQAKISVNEQRLRYLPLAKNEEDRSSMRRVFSELEFQRVTLASHFGLGYGGSQDSELQAKIDVNERKLKFLAVPMSSTDRNLGMKMLNSMYSLRVTLAGRSGLGYSMGNTSELQSQVFGFERDLLEIIRRNERK